MTKRLHWGCGPITPYGWINSDITAWPGVQVVADIRHGLPFPDDEFDYISSIHALPEIPYSEMDHALRELRRVLRPGGVLRLCLPDMEKAIEAYRANDPDYFLIGDDAVQSLSGKMIVQLTWFGQSRCMFTHEFIEELLSRNQFQQVTRCKFQKTSSAHPGIVELDNRELESLYVEATK